MPRKIFNQ